MEETFCFQPTDRVGLFSIRSIGVIYSTSSISAAGRKGEKVADCEIIDVAKAVQAALQQKGFQADLVEINPDHIEDLCRFDWIFNLTETIYGFPLTDYEIASKLEGLKIPFTGSGAQTLQTCLDKAAAKYVLLRNGIDTPAFEVFQPGQNILTQLSYPLFVKPVHEDGSIGIHSDSVVRNEAELRRKVRKIHRLYRQPALVEQYIDGRDITASILGNGENASVLPLSEITYSERVETKFLTFATKWGGDSPGYQSVVARCPCDLPHELDELIKRIALQTYHALECRDYARVDFRLQGARPYVLEVNPNPCINPEDSGFIRCAKAAGYTYRDLVLKILDHAVRNHQPISDVRIAIPAYNFGG